MPNLAVVGTLPIGRFRWHIVRVLALVTVCLYIDRINISIAAPALSAEFHLTAVELGRVLSAFLFGYSLGLIPGGYLADRVGPHRLITVAGILWGIVTILTGCLPGAPEGRNAMVVDLLVAARFALGVCEACALPTFNRAIANWMLKSERAKASGWIHCGAGVGGAATPLLIAALVGRFGWRTAFMVAGILTLAVSVWWWFTAADSPARHPRVTSEEAAAVAAESDGGRPKSPGWAWVMNAIRSRDVYLVCSSMFCFGVAQFVYLTWFYTYFVKARGVAPLDAAALASLPYVAIALASPFGGALCDASSRRFGAPWGRRIVPMAALLLAGACASVAPAISGNTVAAVLFALAAGCQYAAAPAYWSTVIDLTRQGTGILGGVMNSFTYLGSALATIFFPFFVERIGWTRSIQLAGAAAALASLLWLGIHSGRRIDASPAEEHIG